MEVATQTDEVVRKNFAQQTDGGRGEWVKGENEVEFLKEIRRKKEEEDDVVVIAVVRPHASKRRMQSVKTQTAFPTKEKGIQTDWIIHRIEIEESQKSDRDFLLRFISRQWFLIRLKDEFKVPDMLSPMREVEDKAEEWKGWGAGEFIWIEDDKENDKNNDNEKKKLTRKIEEETEKDEKEGLSNNNNNDHKNENKRKRIDDKEEEQTKRMKKEIKREDLQTLEGTRWLNDEVINSYFDLISADEAHGQRVYAMNSFFFPRLHLSGYEAVKRWTRKINIFKYDKVLIPVHLGNHWCLAIINMRSKTITYYDSFKGENPRYLQTLLQYVIAEAQAKGEVVVESSQWSLTTKKDIPRQLNGYDCGVFICQYANKYEAANREMSFSQEEIPQVRQRMMRELQMGNIEI
ncbi:sentrin-specific protease 1-like [Venturia canescens]|uniref:sentrin-specific protease 1-like n=1 Tax=Venturia canescens TaxID=32260 RepID=UPI001C9C43F4|nr:sentrin-specific protease 1-like [Venturia canescens]